DKTVEEVVGAGEVQALKAEIDSLRNSIKEVMDELKSIKSTQTEPSGEPETSDEAIEEPETSEETIDEPKGEDAQAIKGQVGAVKGAHTLYEEMGVDRFGRPL
ncbi:MAG: hypothetical protein ACPLJI_08885, partial [Methanothermobacter sp.]|uniref:hypothetical protein n=1 Tax=Methanothermobacter sp. TaxID=1884223 RepID=UPI003C764C03